MDERGEKKGQLLTGLVRPLLLHGTTTAAPGLSDATADGSHDNAMPFWVRIREIMAANREYRGCVTDLTYQFWGRRHRTMPNPCQEKIYISGLPSHQNSNNY